MQAENPIPEAIAAKHAVYLASATEADKKATQCKDESSREAWKTIAKNYRELAGFLVRNFKL